MEMVLRVALFYLLILVGLRVIGKREFSQLSPLELVTLLLIPEIVSQALGRDDSSITNGVIGVATILTIVYATSLLMQKSKKAEELIAGTPTILVQHGKLIEDNLNRERVTSDEVLTEIHKAGLERLEQVKWGILEADGKISIIPADPDDRDKRGQDQSEPQGV